MTEAGRAGEKAFHTVYRDKRINEIYFLKLNSLKHHLILNFFLSDVQCLKKNTCTCAEMQKASHVKICLLLGLR